MSVLFFHKKNGFEKMIVRVAVSQNPQNCEVSCMLTLCTNLQATPWIGTAQAIQLLQPLHMAATGSRFHLDAVQSRLLSNSFPRAVFMEVVASDNGICKKLHERITNLTNEELRLESTDQIQKLTESIERLLRAHLSFYDTSKQIYQFRLNFALQCFRCPFLDKRLHGMREFDHLTKSALAHGVHHGIATSELAPAERAGRHWIDPINMMRFLQEHCVVQTVFDDSIHEEILQRADGVLNFLQEHGAFGEPAASKP
jgi:hypothetical protein